MGLKIVESESNEMGLININFFNEQEILCVQLEVRKVLSLLTVLLQPGPRPAPVPEEGVPGIPRPQAAGVVVSWK